MAASRFWMGLLIYSNNVRDGTVILSKFMTV